MSCTLAVQRCMHRCDPDETRRDSSIYGYQFLPSPDHLFHGARTWSIRRRITVLKGRLFPRQFDGSLFPGICLTEDRLPVALPGQPRIIFIGVIFSIFSQLSRRGFKLPEALKLNFSQLLSAFLLKSRTKESTEAQPESYVAINSITRRSSRSVCARIDSNSISMENSPTDVIQEKLRLASWTSLKVTT